MIAPRAFLTSAPRALLAGALLCATVLAQAADPAAAVELHGASDVFAAPGVTIAWGILRGATEDATLVVLRMAVDAKTFTHVAVDGVDPFTRERHPLLAGRPVASMIELRTPRPRYAELPRSEVRLFGSAEALRNSAPALVIYYVSIPDTTPEFASAMALGGYLDDRIAKATLK